jgi:hypothetical protein
VSTEPMMKCEHSTGRDIPLKACSSHGPPVIHTDTVTQKFVSYRLRHLPAGVTAASLTMSVASAGPGASVLRGDAQVIWYPPRAAAEHIPAGMHVVTITVSFLNREARGLTRTFTSQAIVSRLADLLNGAHAAPGGITSCPIVQVTYWLAFSSARGAVPSLVAVETGCMILRVSVRGREQPALQMPPGLGTMLARLIYGHGGPGIGAMPPAVAPGG